MLSRPRVVCQESSQYADPTPAAAAAAATQTPPAPSAGEPRAGSGSDGMGAVTAAVWSHGLSFL
jgi:hypothetical protein